MVVVVVMLTMRKRVLLQEGLVSRGLVCEIHCTLETQVLSIILSTAQFDIRIEIESNVNQDIQLFIQDLTVVDINCD